MFYYFWLLVYGKRTIVLEWGFRTIGTSWSNRAISKTFPLMKYFRITMSVFLLYKIDTYNENAMKCCVLSWSLLLFVLLFLLPLLLNWKDPKTLTTAAITLVKITYGLCYTVNILKELYLQMQWSKYQKS